METTTKTVATVAVRLPGGTYVTTVAWQQEDDGTFSAWQQLPGVNRYGRAPRLDADNEWQVAVLIGDLLTHFFQLDGPDNILSQED